MKYPAEMMQIRQRDVAAMYGFFFRIFLLSKSVEQCRVKLSTEK